MMFNNAEFHLSATYSLLTLFLHVMHHKNAVINSIHQSLIFAFAWFCLYVELEKTFFKAIGTVFFSPSIFCPFPCGM